MLVQSYTEYLNEYKKVSLEKEITSFLVVNGFNVLSVKASISDIHNSLEILIKKDELNSDKEHIDNLEKAKNLIIERFYLLNWEIVVG